jgi:hypothetical protein
VPGWNFAPQAHSRVSNMIDWCFTHKTIILYAKITERLIDKIKLSEIKKLKQKYPSSLRVSLSRL